MTTASEINSQADAGSPGRRARYDGRSEARPLRSPDVGRAFGALYRTETMRARLPAILTRAKGAVDEKRSGSPPKSASRKIRDDFLSKPFHMTPSHRYNYVRLYSPLAFLDRTLAELLVALGVALAFTPRFTPATDLPHTVWGNPRVTYSRTK